MYRSVTGAKMAKNTGKDTSRKGAVRESGDFTQKREGLGKKPPIKFMSPIKPKDKPKN